MKKIMFFAAVAAVISLASCQKEALNEAAGTESPVFTATISTGTKTIVNATDGKVAWESTDKITVTDASEASATYKITSIDGKTGKATFEVESGTLGQGPYTATYGTEPATAQNYAATPGNLYMTAPETSANSFTFTVQCGLMEINLTKAGESVKSIAVTGTPTGESETTYTLTCTQAQNIATKKSFYIALPAGSYNKIVITDSEDKVCTLTAASGITVATNHIKPVTFEGSKLDFLPNGALPGVFTVSPEGKKVHFSQGNLTYDINASTNKWKFYEHQYDCATGYDSNLISLFTWGYGTWSTSPNGTDYQTGDFTDWGSQIGDGNTWRTLSTAEWQYLFSDSRMDYGRPYFSNAVDGVTIGGSTYKGVFLYPDNYNRDVISDNSMTWDEINAAGIVFLPAAGYRNGSDFYDFGVSGDYWSSSAEDSDAWYVYFDEGDVYPSSYYRHYRYSVRLITDVK